jgi:hypothetical protein
LSLFLLIICASFDGIAKSGIDNGTTFSQTNTMMPNVIIIKFSNEKVISENSINAENSQLNKQISNAGIVSLKKLFPEKSSVLRKSVSSPLSNIYQARFEGDKSPQEMAKLVSTWPGVVYAEPKYYRYISQEIPNDTSYNIQSEYYQVIQAPEAWEQVKGEQGEVIIAIVDGGTDITHPDLSNNIWQNQDEVDGITGVDDDGNGFVDDYYGWNFANDSGDPSGLSGLPFNADHGTHTAGIASAVTNNITGVAGTSWNTTIMGINAGDETTDRIIAYGYEGIVYAAENGADIISCSWGSLGGYSNFEQEVINYVTSLGSIVIAAAGNNSSDQPHFPSSYDNVLSIAGTTANDDRYDATNYGPDIDLAAPAFNIYSTFNNNTYGYATGTSMAAPMVAGVAGLVKTLNPQWSGRQLGEQVRVTVDSLPAEMGQLGRGRLNAFRAVTEISPSIRLIEHRFEDENENGIIEPGEQINVFITVQNFLSLATGVKLILTSADPLVNISQPEISLSSINSMEQTEPIDPFICEISGDTPPDYTIEFILQIATNEYNDTDHLNLNVLPGYINLTLNNINMTVSSIGRVGNPNPFEETESIGFTYKLTENLLYEGALISGTSASQISNAARAGYGAYDQDFVPTADGQITHVTNETLSDEESFGQYVDQDAANPMGIEISQYTYAWQDLLNDDYIIMRLRIRNRKATDLENFHFGWYFDWDIDGTSYDTNIIRYDGQRSMGYVFDTGSGPESYVGVISLSNEEMNFEPIYNAEQGEFTNEKKWLSISSGIVSEEAGPADVSFVIANGPITIPAYSAHQLAFAFVTGDDSISLSQNADFAIDKWDEIKVLEVEPEEKQELPLTYQLSQNYPNPFNPSTTINYQLSMTNDVELSIYNVLGEKVVTLVSERQAAGKYSVEWDASGLASGVYYYELRADNFRDVKKMVLMK